MATRGRPAFVPTDDHRELIKDLVLVGLPRERICAHIRDPAGKGISLSTLERHFGPELTETKELALCKTAANMYKLSWGESKAAVTAAIFILKTQARWREVHAVEMSGPDGAPIATENVGELTDEQRSAAVARLLSIASARQTKSENKSAAKAGGIEEVDGDE